MGDVSADCETRRHQFGYRLAHRPPGELPTGSCIRDALDQPERRRRSVQGDGEKAWQQGGGNLMAQVSQEAGRADPGHARLDHPGPAASPGSVSAATAADSAGCQ